MKTHRIAFWTSLVGILFLGSVFSTNLWAAPPSSFQDIQAMKQYSDEIPAKDWPYYGRYRGQGALHEFLSFRSGSLYLQGVQTLSVEQATWISKSSWTAVLLPDVKEIDIEALRLLTKASIQTLQLGITELTKERASALAQLKTNTLELPNVKEVELKGLKPLLPWAGEAPRGATNGSTTVRLGLEKLTDLALARSLSRSRWGHIGLPHVQEISPEAMKVLKTFKGGKLEVSLKSATPAVMSELVKWKGRELIFRGSGPVAPQSIQTLAQWKGRTVVFQEVTKLSKEAIQGFKGGTLKYVSFPGMEQLDFGMAMALVSVGGGMEFSFEGVSALNPNIVATMAKKYSTTMKFERLTRMNKATAVILSKYREQLEFNSSQGVRLEVKAPCTDPEIKTLLSHSDRWWNMCRREYDAELDLRAKYDSGCTIFSRYMGKDKWEQFSRDVRAFVERGEKVPRNALCWGLLTTELSSDLVQGLNPAQLRRLRNTIFALQGSRFRSRDLRRFFNKQDWYIPTKASSEVHLTEAAKTNIKVCQLVEQWVAKSDDGSLSKVNFKGRLNGVSVFEWTADGGDWVNLYFVSEKDKKVLLELGGIDAQMTPLGKVSLWQTAEWQLPENTEPPADWKKPDCVEHDVPPEYRRGCEPLYRATLDLNSTFWAVVRKGLGSNITRVVSSKWMCHCQS